MAKKNGNRKIGNNKKSPSMIQYTLGQRWAKNKARRVKKEAARQSLCKAARALFGPIKDMNRHLRKAG